MDEAQYTSSPRPVPWDRIHYYIDNGGKHPMIAKDIAMAAKVGQKWHIAVC